MAGKHRASRTRQRVTETSDYVAMLERLIIAWGDRIAADPAALVHLRDLAAALEQQTNRGIWEANRGQSRYSQNYMASMLGVSRQAIQQRIARGELAAAAITERRGGGAMVRIGDIRARRALLLARAGVPDLTGSERERHLRAVGE